MANTLGVYNPEFYANEALIQLENALGMASRVHRGYDAERRSAQAGENINIRRPSTFTAQNAPSTAQDLNTETVTMTLSNWKEVKFELTDKELALSEERIIDDHIRPAAVALADNVDVALNGLGTDVPWFNDAAGAASLADLTGPYQTLFDNKVPMTEGMLHLEVDGTQQAYFQALTIFHDASIRGAGGETETLRRGSLGHAMGFEVFANQNVQSHVKGTASVTAVLVNGAAVKGATTINLDAASLTGTVVPGDTFVIAGDTQRYAITNTVTAAANAMAGVTFTPGLAAAATDNAAVTLELDDHKANLAFHRNAFAFASAPLPDSIPNQLGALVFTALDPITGLSLRSRIFYVGDRLPERCRRSHHPDADARY